MKQFIEKDTQLGALILETNPVNWKKPLVFMVCPY